MLANLAAHEACKLVVDGVTGACGDDATLDRLADESHVADYVEQLVACALVVPNKRLVLYVAKLSSVATLYVNHVCKRVETLLSGLHLVDDDGVVEVAALDEVGLQQWLDVAYEYEGTCRSNIGAELVDAVECGKL